MEFEIFLNNKKIPRGFAALFDEKLGGKNKTTNEKKKRKVIFYVNNERNLV